MVALPKILFVHPSDEMYGADKVLLESIDALSPSFDVEVWLPRDIAYPERLLSTALKDRGINVRHQHLPVLRSSYMHPQGIASLIPRFVRTYQALRRVDVEAVYVNTSALSPLLPILRALRIPSLLHLHENLGSIVQKQVVGRLMRSASHIVAVSHAITTGLPEDVLAKTSVIYNGFDLEGPHEMPQTEPRTYLLSSRWNAWKGHQLFIEAWGKARLENARLVILGGPPPVGPGLDVPLLVDELPNSDTVELVGQTDNVGKYLADCHFVAVPSTKPDPLPTIAIEAQAAGRPVLANAIGGLPEIIVEGQTGHLTREPTVEEWTRLLIDLPFPGPEVASACRDNFEKKFNRDRYQQEITRQIDKVLLHD